MRYKKPEIADTRLAGKFILRRYVDLPRLVLFSFTFIATFIAVFYAFNFTPRYEAVALLETRVIGSLNSITAGSLLPLSNLQAPTSGITSVVTNSFTAKPTDELNLPNNVSRSQLPATAGNWLREMALIQTSQTIQTAISSANLDLQNPRFEFPLITPLMNWLLGSFGVNVANLPGLNGVELGKTQVPETLSGKEFELKKTAPNEYQLKLPDGSLHNGKFNQPLLFSYKNEAGLLNVISMSENKVEIRKYPLSELSEAISQSLSVDSLDSNGYSNVIGLSYEGKKPAQVALVANAIADAAVKLSREREKKFAVETRDYLVVQRQFIEKNLKQEETLLNRFILDAGTSNLDYQSKALVDQIAEIDKEIREQEVEKIKLEAQNTPLNFQVQQAKAQLKNLQEKKLVLLQQIQKTNLFNYQYSENIKKYQINQTLYLSLSEQIERLNAIIQNPIGDLRIVNYANVPDLSISYSRILIIMIGFICGLIVGYIVTLAIE